MAKKTLNSSSVLLNLYRNKKLVSKVDLALDEGKTYDYIIAFCKEKFNFEINKSALTRYKEKRREAIETGQDLESLLDKRRKAGKIIDIQTKEVTSAEPMDRVDMTIGSVETLYNDVEMLDYVIQKGYAGIKQFPAIEPQLAMKAIEIKAKITGNQLQGVSLAGLRELRLRQTAKEQAMKAIILQFIPEDQHDKVYDAIEQAEQDFYANLDLKEEDRRLTKALADSGYGFD